MSFDEPRMAVGVLCPSWKRKVHEGWVHPWEWVHKWESRESTDGGA